MAVGLSESLECYNHALMVAECGVNTTSQEFGVLQPCSGWLRYLAALCIVLASSARVYDG